MKPFLTRQGDLSMTRSLKCTIAAGLFATILTAPVHAGLVKDIAFGLSEAGFQFIGEENPLSGGADLTIGRNFTGQTLDFGATELTLTGTPTFTMSTGGRGLQVLDFSFNTGANPLNYTLVADTGNQTVTTVGTFFMDITGSVNSFGYYDLNFDVSSRQTVTEDGRILTDTFENDFDIGPIDISGNLFADLLGAVTDPIFQVLGIENIFYQFSAAGQFEDIMANLVQDATAKIDAGYGLTDNQLADLTSLAAAGAALGAQIPDLSYLTASGTYNPPIAAVVPEPATLMLLLAATPLALRRKKTNRTD